MKRRSLVTTAVNVTLGAALPWSWRASLAAEDYPARPVQVIVPYAPGGADVYIRPMQPMLEKRHNLRLVIESVVGAGGTVGSARVKRSAPDGYTLLFCGSGAFTIAPRLQATGAPVAADFIPLVNIATVPYIIATRKGSAIRDTRGLIDFIKSNPGALNYGSPGIGSSPHLGMEALARNLGSSVTHVAYSGIATAMQALLGGHIEAVIGAPSTVLPQMQNGAVTGIVLASKDRFPLAPDLPTLADVGIDIDVSTHFAFYAPKGTPQPVVAKLSMALGDVAADPTFKQALESTRTLVDVLPSDVLARVLGEEQVRFGPMIAAVKNP